MNRQETQAIVLDFLPHGQSSDSRRVPIAQVLGKNNLTLLEVIPKRGVFLEQEEEVYIGEGERPKIHHVKGRILLKDLTRTAQDELEDVLNALVAKEEAKYLNFYNTSSSVSLRMHKMELLPGIGKKHMIKILEERRIKPFESFEDLKQRVELLPDPKRAIVQRILEELNEEDKYNLFTQPPMQQDNNTRYGNQKRFDNRRRY